MTTTPATPPGAPAPAAAPAASPAPAVVIHNAPRVAWYLFTFAVALLVGIAFFTGRPPKDEKKPPEKEPVKAASRPTTDAEEPRPVAVPSLPAPARPILPDISIGKALEGMLAREEDMTITLPPNEWTPWYPITRPVGFHWITKDHLLHYEAKFADGTERSTLRDRKPVRYGEPFDLGPFLRKLRFFHAEGGTVILDFDPAPSRATLASPLGRR